MALNPQLLHNAIPSGTCEPFEPEEPTTRDPWDFLANKLQGCLWTVRSGLITLLAVTVNIFLGFFFLPLGTMELLVRSIFDPNLAQVFSPAPKSSPRAPKPQDSASRSASWDVIYSLIAWAVIISEPLFGWNISTYLLQNYFAVVLYISSGLLSTFALTVVAVAGSAEGLSNQVVDGKLARRRRPVEQDGGPYQLHRS